MYYFQCFKGLEGPRGGIGPFGFPGELGEEVSNLEIFKNI